MTTRPPTRPGPQPAWMLDSWHCGVLFQNQRKKERECSKGVTAQTAKAQERPKNTTMPRIKHWCGLPARREYHTSPAKGPAAIVNPASSRPRRPLATACSTSYPCKCELHGFTRLAAWCARNVGRSRIFTRATTRANFGAFPCINRHFKGISPTSTDKKKRLANCCLRAV